MLIYKYFFEAFNLIFTWVSLLFRLKILDIFVHYFIEVIEVYPDGMLLAKILNLKKLFRKTFFNGNEINSKFILNGNFSMLLFIVKNIWGLFGASKIYYVAHNICNLNRRGFGRKHQSKIFSSKPYSLVFLDITSLFLLISQIYLT